MPSDLGAEFLLDEPARLAQVFAEAHIVGSGEEVLVDIEADFGRYIEESHDEAVLVNELTGLGARNRLMCSKELRGRVSR